MEMKMSQINKWNVPPMNNITVRGMWWYHFTSTSHNLNYDSEEKLNMNTLTHHNFNSVKGFVQDRVTACLQKLLLR